MTGMRAAAPRDAVDPAATRAGDRDGVPRPAGRRRDVTGLRDRGRHPRLLRSRVGGGVLALAAAAAQVAAPPTIATAAGAGVGPVRAAPRPIVVLESYVGARPADAGAIMAPLLDELDARGFAADPQAVVARIGGRAPRPGALDLGLTAAEIAQQADAGFAAYTRGRFAEAEAQLTAALDRIHRNPALLVLDTSNLDATFKVLVALALSQARRGDTAKTLATMVELFRTFRSQPITRAEYGPDAEQLYRAVGKQVQAMGKGQLAITVDRAQAVIFVDGQLRGLGKAALADLIPGVYRVFVQVPATAGRQYEIEVGADERTELHVDWEVDSTLALTDRWVGLLFATEADRARQAVLAGALARRWRQLVTVVGLARQRGASGQRDTVAVTASFYDTTGAAAGRASVAIAAPDAIGGLAERDDHQLRALARYLADGTASDRVAVTAPLDHAIAATTRSRLVPGLFVGAGAVAVLAGGALYALDQGASPDLPGADRNAAPAGLAIGAVGLAAVGVGLWMWRARGRSSAPVVAIGSGNSFIGWAGEL